MNTIDLNAIRFDNPMAPGGKPMRHVNVVGIRLGDLTASDLLTAIYSAPAPTAPTAAMVIPEVIVETVDDAD